MQALPPIQGVSAPTVSYASALHSLDCLSAARDCDDQGPMKTRVFVLFILVALGLSSAGERVQSDRRLPVSVVVKAAKLLDVRSGLYIEKAALWIEGERISEVGPAAEVQSRALHDAKVIDLGHATVLPGLIDCHTHIMARIADADGGYALSLATKSQAFRALDGA